MKNNKNDDQNKPPKIEPFLDELLGNGLKQLGLECEWDKEILAWKVLNPDLRVALRIDPAHQPTALPKGRFGLALSMEAFLENYSGLKTYGLGEGATKEEAGTIAIETFLKSALPPFLSALWVEGQWLQVEPQMFPTISPATKEDCSWYAFLGEIWSLGDRLEILGVSPAPRGSLFSLATAAIREILESINDVPVKMYFGWTILLNRSNTGELSGTWSMDGSVWPLPPELLSGVQWPDPNVKHLRQDFSMQRPDPWIAKFPPGQRAR